MEFFTYYLPLIANFLMELQYCQFLNILRSRFKELNKCLLKNTDLMPSKIGEILTILPCLYSMDCFRFSDRIHHNEGHSKIRRPGQNN